MYNPNEPGSKKYIALSGGFDPIHKGHLQMIREARIFAPVLILLNSDGWLMRKKGFVFMSQEERTYILNSLEDVSGVHKLTTNEDANGTVINAIHNCKNEIRAFGKGGDRVPDNTPEIETCLKLGIPIIFGLGGDKIQSSSELVKRVQKNQ